jgi:hypothetical protein
MDDAVSLMINISKTAEEAMGGTSGALYSYVLSMLLNATELRLIPAE